MLDNILPYAEDSKVGTAYQRKKYVKNGKTYQNFTIIGLTCDNPGSVFVHKLKETTEEN